MAAACSSSNIHYFQSCFKQEQINKGIITPDSLERSWWAYLPEHGAKHGV
jgi:hypothetical protein